MNARSAYRTTANALAFLGQQRAKQTLFHKLTNYVDFVPVSHVYLVVPDGKEQGDYWHISEANLWRLQRGQTPEYIGCELAEADDEPRPEYADEDRDNSAADRKYQAMKEQF